MPAAPLIGADSAADPAAYISAVSALTRRHYSQGQRLAAAEHLRPQDAGEARRRARACRRPALTFWPTTERSEATKAVYRRADRAFWLGVARGLRSRTA